MSAPRLINPPTSGGGGGGTVGGSGTPGTLPIWTAATTLGDSAIVQVAGAIATVTLTAGGTLYTNGTYSQQALTGGTGTGATADIVVAGGIVTSCVLRSPGTGYAAVDALSCATIGAGAGFVLTVATVTTSDNTVGNLTALGRIGAGTATPRAALDVVGGVWVNGFEPANAPSTYSQTTGILSFSRNFATIRAGVQTFDASVAGTSFIYSVSATPQLTNFTGSYAGLQIFPNTVSSSGTQSITGTTFRHLRTTPGDLATQSVLGSSVLIQAFTGVASAASYAYSTVTGFQFSHNFAAAGTTATLTAFYASAFTLSAGHVVTDAYGLRLQAASISGGASITNRWGISQEDAAARNVLSGATVIGAAAGTSPATGTKLDVLGLTADRAAGTYTIQPTAWWAGDVYSQLVVDSTAETGGLTKPTTGPGYVAAITSIPRYDLSLRGTTAVYGIQSQPLLEAATLTGTSNVIALDGSTNLNQSGITAKTIALVGVSGGASISTVGATVTASLTGVSSAVGNFATTAVAHSSVEQFLGTPSTFSGAAHTITNFYGLRLRTTTLSGGATITNRWGISQEDTLASNQFSAVTNTFSGIVRATGSTAAAPAFSTPADTDTGMYFPSANTVRIGTGGSPGLEIDSSQNLKFNSGYGTTTTAYGCRAWVNFIGATAVIRGSGGVSSLTRPSAGTYIINYTSTMPDTGYAAIATKQSVASNSDCQLYDLFASRTTTSSTWVNVEGAAVADSANINIAFFR